MNKKQKSELEQLRTKWRFNSSEAVSDRTSYVLDRARKDYEKVVGADASGVGLARWQSDCLKSVVGIGTMEEVTKEVADSIVSDAVQAVESVFSEFDSGTITHAIGQTVIERVKEAVEQDLISPETASESISSDSPGTVPVAFLSRFRSRTWAVTGVSALLIGLGLVVSSHQSAWADTYEPGQIVVTSGNPRAWHRDTVDVVIDTYAGVFAMPKVGVSPVFDEAMKYQGVPYRSTKYVAYGFDCSGFTKYVYSKFGIDLYHGARVQRDQNRVIPRSEARLGDLVYMPGHIGFWAGNGLMLDSPNDGKTIGLHPIWYPDYEVVRITQTK